MICYIPMGFRCFYRSFNFSFIWSLKTCRFLMNLIKKRFRSATLKILFPQILQFLSYKRRHLELHLRILSAIKLWNVFIIHLHTTAVLRFSSIFQLTLKMNAIDIRSFVIQRFLCKGPGRIVLIYMWYVARFGSICTI